MALHPNNIVFITGSEDTTLKIWRVEDLNCIDTLEGHLSAIQSVTYLSDGSKIVSASADKSIKIWDNLTHKCIKTLDNAHSSIIKDVKESPFQP